MDISREWVAWTFLFLLVICLFLLIINAPKKLSTAYPQARSAPARKLQCENSVYKLSTKTRLSTWEVYLPGRLIHSLSTGKTKKIT
jgi:hypothetical protein